MFPRGAEGRPGASKTHAPSRFPPPQRFPAADATRASLTSSSVGLIVVHRSIRVARFRRNTVSHLAS